MRLFRLFLAIFLLHALPAHAASITVSAAISLKEAVSQIAHNFETQSSIHVDLNFGASGQLADQITQGAPVDAFISAGSREMDQLAAHNLIDPASRRNICGNELVLILSTDVPYIPRSFGDLADKRVGRIAVGRPLTVPAGQYAKEVFDHLQITPFLTPKLVYCENVRQVLDYVERGEVDAGVVYATDALEAGAKVNLSAHADPSWHSPIVYPAAVLKASADGEAARRFLDFVGSDQSRAILVSHGFVMIDKPATVPAP